MQALVPMQGETCVICMEEESSWSALHAEAPFPCRKVGSRGRTYTGTALFLCAAILFQLLVALQATGST